MTAGVKPKVPKQSALMGATIGALGGFMLAYQQSSGMCCWLCNNVAEYQTGLLEHLLLIYIAGRLMGFFPNDKEVETALAKK